MSDCILGQFHNFWWPFFSRWHWICNFPKIDTFPSVSQRLHFTLFSHILPCCLSISVSIAYFTCFFLPPVLTMMQNASRFRRTGRPCSHSMTQFIFSLVTVVNSWTSSSPKNLCAWKLVIPINMKQVTTVKCMESKALASRIKMYEAKVIWFYNYSICDIKLICRVC